MKLVIDPGHCYLLLSLDGIVGQTLTFVKRCDSTNPSRFPGNTNAYAGTTLQSVLRCLCDRVRYLQKQVWGFENVVLLFCLRLAIWMLEFRGARRHNKSYWHGLNFAEFEPMCSKCGHTVCDHYWNEVRNGTKVFVDKDKKPVSS